MSLHVQRRIDRIKRMLLDQGAQVEDALVSAIQAMEERDPDLARSVIYGDGQIDRQKADLEEACLSLLALNQPVALDLRYVISTLKINQELERVADLAAGIAEQAVYLSALPEVSYASFELPEMTRAVRVLLRRGLDALVDVDPDVARWVIDADAKIRAVHEGMYGRVEKALAINAGGASVLLHVLGVSRNLNRIADHAVGIANDVIYMAEGQISRRRQLAV